MIFQILYPYMKFTLGSLYPTYKTWKALKRKDDTIKRRWMKYWINFGAFQMFELISDMTLAYILPFYIELKLIAIVWLVTGTKLIFDSIVNRELTKWEKIIDKWLRRGAKLQEEFIALIWREVSKCFLKIITNIMHGGLHVLSDPTKMDLDEPNGRESRSSSISNTSNISDTNNNTNNENYNSNPTSQDDQMMVVM